MEKVDLNRPLRYRHEEHMGTHYSCEVARFGSSNDDHFLVIFYKKKDRFHFSLKPNIDGSKYLENVPEKKPWTELSQVPLNAWFRKKEIPNEVTKIESISINSGLLYFSQFTQPYTVRELFDQWEYTDNPLSKDAKWHFCGTE